MWILGKVRNAPRYSIYRLNLIHQEHNKNGIRYVSLILTKSGKKCRIKDKFQDTLNIFFTYRYLSNIIFKDLENGATDLKIFLTFKVLFYTSCVLRKSWITALMTSRGSWLACNKPRRPGAFSTKGPRGVPRKAPKMTNKVQAGTCKLNSVGHKAGKLKK